MGVGNIFRIGAGVFAIWVMTGAPKSLAAEPDSLGALAARAGIRFGVSVKSAILASDAAYRELIRREFTSVTPEYEMKFSEIQPHEGVFDFARTDALSEFALAHGMQARAHALVWHRQIPYWLKPESRSPAELARILHAHIETVVRHHKEKMPNEARVWDVVNEALGETGGVRSSPWMKIGNSWLDYIELAFRSAHAADPSAKLFYNDYGTETPGRKANDQYNLLAALKQRGVPVHGVGFQAHLTDQSRVQAQDLRREFARLAALGLEIHITEADVALPTNPPPSPRLLQRQAQIFQALLAACRLEPACKSLTVWGASDRESWIPAHYPGTGAGLLFDQERRPKPAYTALHQLLE